MKDGPFSVRWQLETFVDDIYSALNCSAINRDAAKDIVQRVAGEGIHVLCTDTEKRGLDNMAKAY
jgi:ABC-type sugar transport system substrate-binding protein